MFNNILIVCIGNICRSPITEGLFKQFALLHNIPVQISSAGLNACVGESAHPLSQQLMLEKSIDISHHRARQISTEMVTSADLILVMENAHLQTLKSHFPFAQGKVHLLGKWSQNEIPDPYYRTLPEFKAVFNLIEQGTLAWQTKLWN